VLREVTHISEREEYLPEISDFDLDWRPVSYENPSDFDSYLDGGIKAEAAEHRRETILNALKQKQSREWKLGEENETIGTEGIHLWLNTGGYLPAFKAGEVEIARVAFPISTLSDATSIRARQVDGKYHFRVEDEYDGDFVNEAGIPTPQDKPLSLGEIISLIDGCELVAWHRESLGVDRAEAFPEVHSAVYPALSLWYRAEDVRWLKKNGWDERDDGSLCWYL
jgi:hypothetical protein